MPEQDPMAAIDAHLQPPPEAGAAPAPPDAPPAPPDAPAGELPPDVAARIDAHLPAAPAEDPFVAALRDVAARKYAALLAYATYGDQLQTFSRDGLKAHFDDHVADERAGLYEVHRTLAALGASAFPTGVTVPEVPLGAERPAVEALAGMEAELLGAWAACEAALDAAPRDPGETYALRALVQDGARADLAHLQDLRRYLGGGA